MERYRIKKSRKVGGNGRLVFHNRHRRKELKTMKEKIINYILKKHNEKITKKINNIKFLEGLCTENGTLNLNKYYRLIKMIKRKYK